ncbi:MAG: lysophospholipid acyltransferase family protein [Gammaproteobacteria bacterium]
MSKAFISKNNPFNEDTADGECFSYSYLLPKYWISWILIFLSFPLAYLPKIIRPFLGSMLGKMLFQINTSKKEIVKINLKKTFKNLNDNDLERYSVKFFKYLGHIYLCLPLLWWRSDSYLQTMIHKDGTQHVDDILNNNQSVILLAPHTLSLDFGGRALSQYNLLSIYKPFKNKLMNWFIGKSRSKLSDKVIVYPRHGSSIKNIIKKMRQPSVLYLLADEDISRDDSIFCDFFDAKKAVLKSISKLSRMTNSKVLPCVCNYNLDSQDFYFKIFPSLDNFPSENIIDDCSKINRVFEKQILEDKLQYMWTLRIYKHQPDSTDIYKI